MEDRNMLAADCIVICCCPECLILQILIFILLKIPHKLVKKIKEYAKKLRARKKVTKIMQIEMRRYDEDSLRSSNSTNGNSLRIEIEDFFGETSLRFDSCMDEIEGVLEEFSCKGEFAFGSFWGASRSFRSCMNEQELDYDDVQYRLIELFGSNVNFSCH